MPDLGRRVALVTGAAGGIGYAIAARLTRPSLGPCRVPYALS